MKLVLRTHLKIFAGITDCCEQSCMFSQLRIRYESFINYLLPHKVHLLRFRMDDMREAAL